MNYNEKIEAAKRSVTEYYTAVLPDRPADMPGDHLYDKELDATDRACRFIENLKKMGAIREEGLAVLSHEDILSVLDHVGTIQPKVLAKQIASVFRLGEDGRKYTSSRRAEAMSDRELIEAYDINDPTNSVGARLKAMSRGQKFLLIDQNGGPPPDFYRINISDSLALLMEAKAGYNGRDHFQGRPTYRVGDTITKLVNENPLYPAHPLRPDDTCDITNRSWSKICLRDRQFARFLVTKGAIKIADEMIASNIIDIAEANKLQENVFAKYVAEFNQLESEGKLPTLKMSLSSATTSTPPKNLFQGRKVS